MRKNIEKALKEFLMDIRITGEERKKGIPLITFVYKEEDKAVLLKALPLPLADIQPEKTIPVGKEVLYRVDFFKEGEAKVSFGILPEIKEPAMFLTLLEICAPFLEPKEGHHCGNACHNETCHDPLKGGIHGRRILLLVCLCELHHVFCKDDHAHCPDDGKHKRFQVVNGI